MSVHLLPHIGKMHPLTTRVLSSVKWLVVCVSCPVYRAYILLLLFFYILLFVVFVISFLLTADANSDVCFQGVCGMSVTFFRCVDSNCWLGNRKHILPTKPCTINCQSFLFHNKCRKNVYLEMAVKMEVDWLLCSVMWCMCERVCMCVTLCVCVF